MNEKITIIGAGSAVFTKGLIADFIAKKWNLTIGLVDTDLDALAVAKGLAERMVQIKNREITIEASTERRDVLPGSTVVICTVGVGGRAAWLKDVLIPRKYGIFQPVGDTIMPGGLSRALRMIPAMIAIAEDVQDLCPNALFFNYGNPMSAVCRGIRKVTNAPVIGLCHGVNHVAHFLAELLNSDPKSISYNAIGVNHLTWFTELRANGADIMPLLRSRADKEISELFEPDGAARSIATEPGRSPFSWQLMKTFGAFPAVLDRHVTEFFPSLFRGAASYYGATLGTDCYNIERVIEGGDKSFEEMKSIASGVTDIPEDFFHRSSGEHEQVVDIIESVRTDNGRIYSANLPNTGQVPNLPTDAVVESPAVADGSGIRAIQQKSLSPGVAGTLQRPFAAIEAVVAAAIDGNRDRFVEALIIDGSVSDMQTAHALADELVEAQANYLPSFGQE